VFSPFDFEKLCLKGGLEAKLFAFHFTTDNFQEKNRGREKIIFPFYISNSQVRYIIGDLDVKMFYSGLLRNCQSLSEKAMEVKAILEG